MARSTTMCRAKPVCRSRRVTNRPPSSERLWVLDVVKGDGRGLCFTRGGWRRSWVPGHSEGGSVCAAIRVDVGRSFRDTTECIGDVAWGGGICFRDTTNILE